MWKKNEAVPPAEPRGALRAGEDRRLRQAVIGPSISIKGDLSGDEDLVIEGHVEGKITLKDHSVTVGRHGRLKADIRGKSIRVEGEVEGNLFGQEEVVIRQSGRVEGNLTAPRVTLEDGSRFRGSIDMNGSPKSSESVARAKPPKGQTSPSPRERALGAGSKG